MSDTEKSHFVFRLNDNGVGPNLLQQVCLERGWRSYEDRSTTKKVWNLWWRTKGFPVFQCYQLDKEQFTNHIPHATFICRKDNLIRCMKCMRKIYGSSFDFIPDGFHLPLEYKKLLSKCKNETPQMTTRADINDEIIWICKPVGLSQGRGITLFQNPSDLVYSSSAVVQKYVKNPLLIGGYKFDLRLYVLVPSFHPLTVYIYREGLVRFSTEKFSITNLNNRFAHLTNSSLNKLSPGYLERKERIGAGCKWNLQQLRCYLQQTIGSDWLLWQNISSIIVLTIASQLAKIPSTVNCFEFYGFDILIDSDLKPWLIEVNSSPALSIDCSIDPLVKKPMIHDMFDLIGLPVCNTGLLLYTDVDHPPAKSSSREPVALKAAVKRNEKRLRACSGKLRKKNGLLRRTRLQNNSKVLKANSTRWGNGENWNNSKASEGNWVRTYPLALEDENRVKFTKAANNGHRTFSTNEIKSVVSSTVAFLKTATGVWQANPDLKENQLHSLMKPYLLPNAEIWIPSL